MEEDEFSAKRPPSWPPTSDALLTAMVQQCIALTQAINAKVDLLVVLTKNQTYSADNIAKLKALDQQVIQGTAGLQSAIHANPVPDTTE
jgi:hypothetical protein